MKLKLFFLSLMMLLPSVINCQNSTIQRLQGSWLGRVTTKDFSLRLLLRFKVSNNKIMGYIDSPDQGIKDLPIDRVWTVEDSLFADATTTTGDGMVFRGLLVPGDSAINGVWGGTMAVRLSRTNYVFKLKTNLNPEIEGYRIIKLIKSTPVKDQQATGTCWSHATTSFIETEAIRLGKSPVVLSPMYYVFPTYIDKAEKYIRMEGISYFAEGGLTFNVMNAYKNWGAIPETVYSGRTDTAFIHYHGMMNNALLERAKYYVKSGRGKMTNEGYKKDMEEILSATMGKIPDTFVYQQKNYTPKSFASEMIGINPDDYVEITSFTHHPFYSKFILEVRSNWHNDYYLNLPIDDFINVLDHALLNNYSVCWDGDIFEGYSNGFAVLSDSIKNITQQMRQMAFDNYTTKDVHNMHIIGIAENEKGNKFYIVKNSSDGNNCGGYLYMSKEFLLLKTISIMVHKEAIPKIIKNKLPKPIL